MKIERMAMYVNNLEKARKFFVIYFNASSNDGYYKSCIIGLEDDQIEISV
jgi:hypothetical protein